MEGGDTVSTDEGGPRDASTGVHQPLREARLKGPQARLVDGRGSKRHTGAIVDKEGPTPTNATEGEAVLERGCECRVDGFHWTRGAHTNM